jgi:hypothetical protein
MKRFLSPSTSSTSSVASCYSSITHAAGSSGKSGKPCSLDEHAILGSVSTLINLQCRNFCGFAIMRLSDLPRMLETYFTKLHAEDSSLATATILMKVQRIVSKIARYGLQARSPCLSGRQVQAICGITIY